MLRPAAAGAEPWRDPAGRVPQNGCRFEVRHLPVDESAPAGGSGPRNDSSLTEGELQELLARVAAGE